MVHPSSQWSKRHRGVGGQWQPIGLLEFFRGNRQSSIMRVHAGSYWRGKELTREGVGKRR